MPEFSFWQRDIYEEDRRVGAIFHANEYRQGLRDARRELVLRSGEVNVLRVSRTRKGQWGEWFEVWVHRGDGKVRLEREGWM